ncbi:MAG: amino acid ABC transporter ATP-binding protein [Oscillospiraceae bacterium]|jgi:ABC-type polar amino acid transport system ATPase subunit|nr:amino acid ABC transporter ATP-binding protein [Oscillospiraceae bacterium]
MLNIENLFKSFRSKAGAIDVLNGVNLEIADGEVVSILGPSGAGKSTLLRCVNFLEYAERGVMTLDGYRVDAARASKADILHMRRSTAMVFQNYNLFQNKTALDNVAEGLLVRGISRAAARDKARGMLGKVGMLDKADEYPSRLSGGQQQRVGIARALALEPSILLLDEPTSALDSELVGEVLKVIRDLVRERITMLIVTHEIRFGREISDRVAFFDEGAIVEYGSTESFFNSPQSERTQRFLQRYNQNA